MREVRGAQPRLEVTVAANVRAEMARHRVSGRELAQRVGRSQTWLSRRLVGEIAFALDELEAVSIALDVPVARLMGIAA